jgi:hypothetical protein
VYPNIFASDYYYNILFDGGIGRILSGIPVRALKTKRLYDGLYYNLSTADFDADLNEFVVDGIIITYDSGITVECGFFSDPLIYEGDVNLSYVLSSVQYRELDGGPIIRDETGDIARDNGKNLFLPEALSTRKTQIADQDDQQDVSTTGHIFVRDVVSGITTHLSSALSSVLTKYPANVVSETLSGVLDFNIYEDLIYIRTINYFIVDKLTYNENSIGSSTYNNSIFAPSSAVVEISQPFFFEDRDYALMCKVELINTESNNCIIQPVFYKLKYSDATLHTQISENIQYASNLNIRFCKIKSPIMVYNSRNQVYTLLATIYDANDLPYILQMYFDYDDGTIIDRRSRIVNLVNVGDVRTTNFNNYAFSETFEVNSITQSTTLNVASGELIIYGTDNV